MALCKCLNFNWIPLPASHHGLRRDAEANEGPAIGGGEGSARWAMAMKGAKELCSGTS